MTGTFVPIYQGLSASDFVGGAERGAPCFPFNVPDRLPFFRARNAIYHLFRALVAAHPTLEHERVRDDLQGIARTAIIRRS